jgi:hypothetical protein
MYGFYFKSNNWLSYQAYIIIIKFILFNKVLVDEVMIKFMVQKCDDISGGFVMINSSFQNAMLF